MRDFQYEYRRNSKDNFCSRDQRDSSYLQLILKANDSMTKCNALYETT